MNVENTIVKLTDVAMSYDRRQVLHDVNLSVGKGDFLAVTGPNGGGKTTLMRIILRLITPTAGSVECFNVDGKDLTIGYLPQKNMIDSRFPITVSDVVELGLYGRKDLSPDQRRDRISETLDAVGMDLKSNACLGELSGGQLQRTLLARAIISDPQLLVLDEPLSYVDKHFEQRIYDIIEDIARRSTIILVSHEISTIAAMANRHVIVDGSLHFCHSASHFIHYDCCDGPARVLKKN